MMRKGQQIQGRGFGDKVDVGHGAKNIDEVVLDGPSGKIGDVDDPADRVGRFFRDVELLVRAAVKGDTDSADQDFFDILWPEQGQLINGRLVSEIGSYR
jgi:hypothetical protein